MKIFICPSCGRMTVGSRKKELFCSKCNETAMICTKISFEKYSKMNELQRKNYAESWLYIHKTASGKAT